MRGTSAAAQDLVAGANGSKVALKGMTAATKTSKVALLGAKVAAIAFNAALTMGISLLVDFAISGIMKLVNAKQELAEKVDEITSKFREQHDELLKLKDDFDTTSESSMISKYEKLSKGVDGLGRNISLTADEYSEYQSIVGEIASQFPSLVSGYDEQGNALLSCKGNVEQLTDAYEKLIHTQNQEILTNTSDIEKDFANTVKSANKQGFWKSVGNILGLRGILDQNMTTDAAEVLNDLLNTDRDNLGDKIKKIQTTDYQTFREIITALKDAGVDTGAFDLDPAKTLEETINNDPSKIKGIVDNFFGTFNDAVDEQKTIAQAKLSEAFDVGSTGCCLSSCK